MKHDTLHYLARLALRPLPSFVTRGRELRELRRLAERGYVDARFYPPRPCKSQFACVQHLTPRGVECLALADSER